MITCVVCGDAGKSSGDELDPARDTADSAIFAADTRLSLAGHK